jgi:tetratricopeptide (TPR) repeat protein
VAYSVGAAADFHWELAGATAPVVLLAATAAVHASGTARLTSAETALRAGNSARAAADARAALRFAPFSADAWRVLGEADASAAAYRRALELDRNDWSLWLGLASVSKGAPHRLALREAMRLNPLLSGS